MRTALGISIVDPGSKIIWTPADLPSPLLVLEPKTIVQSGGVVTQWLDTSGGNRHYSEATLRPTYSALGGPGGNKPAATFIDGGGGVINAQRLVGPTFSATACHFFIVAKKNTSPGIASEGAGGLCTFEGPLSSGIAIPFTNGLHYHCIGTSARKDAIASPGSVASYFLLEVVSTASEYTAYWNRTQYFTTATNTVAWPSTDTRLGVSPAGNSWWEGEIAAVYMYGAKLSAGNQTTIRNYILAEIGV